MEPATEITSLLKRLSQGEREVQDELYPLIYRELKKLAAGQLAKERPGASWQPTALVHETYLRLVQIREIDWVSRGHFYAMAARAMRRILISHARARLSLKRGEGAMHVDLESIPATWENREPVLIALDQALERLEIESPRAYRLVELKFFGGLNFEEAALALNVSSRTLKRDWETAKAWLYREMSKG